MPGLPRRSISAVSSLALPPSRDRGVGDRRRAFPDHVIDDIQDPAAATIGELVKDKIRRPAGIRPSLDQDRRSGAYAR